MNSGDRYPGYKTVFSVNSSSTEDEVQLAEEFGTKVTSAKNASAKDLVAENFGIENMVAEEIGTKVNLAKNTMAKDLVAE